MVGVRGPLGGPRAHFNDFIQGAQGPGSLPPPKIPPKNLLEILFLMFKGPGGPQGPHRSTGDQKYLRSLILGLFGSRRGRFRPVLEILCF